MATARRVVQSLWVGSGGGVMWWCGGRACHDGSAYVWLASAVTVVVVMVPVVAVPVVAQLCFPILHRALTHMLPCAVAHYPSLPIAIHHHPTPLTGVF